MRMFKNKLSFILLVALAVALPGVCHAGGDITLDRAEVEAGFIYHLSKLVTWPEGSFEKANSPIIVGFLGDEDTANYFEEHAPGFEAQGRKLHVKRFAFPAQGQDPFVREKFIQETKNCNILFVSDKVQIMDSEYAELLDTPGLLTVGETKSFVESKGMIGLVVLSGKFNVFANVDNLKSARLEVSAKFLQHAKIIENKKEKK